jgi:hypothetical protein
VPPLYVDAYRPTIEVYGPPAGVGLWDDPASTWDGPGDVWTDTATAAPAWRSVACQVSAFSSSWGADQATGVLAQSAAGVLTLKTYDPDRLLDPSNTASPLFRETRIGTPIRVTLAPAGVLGYGYLDEIDFRYEDSAGSITAADDISKLAQANTAPDFWQPANSLRALAVAAIASAGQTVPVGPAPAAGDPVVAFRETRDQPVWALIRDAAQDALCLAWMDDQTSPPTLRFSPYGYPTDQGLRLGDGGIPLAALAAVGSGSGAINVVDDATGELARRITVTGRDQTFDVSRVEPAGGAWARAILADRGGAVVTLVPGEILPSSMGELTQLVQARGLDFCRVSLIGQPIDATLRVLGGKLEGEAGGVYRATLAVYGPSTPWAYLPPPPAATASTPSSRSMRATKDSGINFGGSIAPGTIRSHGYGLGPIEVGRTALGPFQYAALLAFDGFDYTGIRRVRKIELVIVYDRNSGAAVPVDVQRIAGQWAEGRAKSTDTGPTTAGNAVVWPGPPVDAAAVSASLTGSAALAEQRIDITSIATVNLPVNLGGRGYPDFGYRVLGTTAVAADVYLAAKETPDDEPTSTGCRLELTVEV